MLCSSVLLKKEVALIKTTTPFSLWDGLRKWQQNVVLLRHSQEVVFLLVCLSVYIFYGAWCEESSTYTRIVCISWCHHAVGVDPFPAEAISRTVGDWICNACFSWRIKHVTASPYYPQASQVERFNRNLKAALTIYHHSQHVLWDENLPMLTMAFNSAWHESIGAQVRLHPQSSKIHKRSAKIDLKWSDPMVIAKHLTDVTVQLVNPVTGWF